MSRVGLVLLFLQYVSELGFHIARLFYFTDENHQKMWVTSTGFFNCSARQLLFFIDYIFWLRVALQVWHVGSQLCVYTDGHSDPDVPGRWVWLGSCREPGAGLGDGQLQHCTDKVMTRVQHPWIMIHVVVLLFMAAVTTVRSKHHKKVLTFKCFMVLQHRFTPNVGRDRFTVDADRKWDHEAKLNHDLPCCEYQVRCPLNIQ